MTPEEQMKLAEEKLLGITQKLIEEAITETLAIVRKTTEPLIEMLPEMMKAEMKVKFERDLLMGRTISEKVVYCFLGKLAKTIEQSKKDGVAKRMSELETKVKVLIEEKTAIELNDKPTDQETVRLPFIIKELKELNDEINLCLEYLAKDTKKEEQK